MNISVVIPLLNEEESIKELYLWITKVMQANSFSYEVIFIDDGSTDTSWSIIDSLHKQHPQIKAIQFLRNFGKSQALHAGFAMAQGDVVITMDADLQDNPEEIPELYNMVCKQGYDLVSGWKKVRYDSKIFKNFPSKIFNWAARKTSGVQLNDFNCGLKAYHKNVIKNIEVTGEMHRYIPVLASNAGFTKIGEKIVQHQARKYGSTKFGVDRFTHGFLDLLTLWFFSRFGRRPMHLFGALGAFMLTIGFLFAFYLGVDKLFINTTGRLITERPQFYIAITAMIIGSQLFLAGFLGELLLRSKKENSNYSIKNTL
ncbi:glycosyltransferase family 2 protein [Flavobacteriaceae bacterium]|nr:glycosyltransferase family 2 protein [Flavobacteriaceae bacterium]